MTNCSNKSLPWSDRELIFIRFVFLFSLFCFHFSSDCADKCARFFEMTEEGQTEADSPFTVFVLCLRFLFFHFLFPTQPQHYIMATLLPSLSSDEENDPLNDSEEEEVDDISQDFIFGGLLVRLTKVSIWFVILDVNSHYFSTP